MKRCLELATLGAGHVSPNPMVGAVIVHGEEIIGEGWHRRYGEPHAEVNAIRDAEERHGSELLGESTLYVNLEPCSHWGKTPPCADLIIEKGIPRVVVGCIDTYCEVSGRGVEKLRQAGVEVTVGILEKEALYLNRRFFTAQNKKRPYVILKWAQTQDGYLDAGRFSANVPPAWMTGENCRMLVHRWRAEEDAIMVGRHTAQMDNPSLTVRSWPGRNPIRVVTDRRLQLSENLKIFDYESSTILFTDQALTEQAQEKFADPLHISVEGLDYGRATLAQILDRLADPAYRIQSLIVEGGAALLSSFIAAGLWDEARIFISPLWVGELYKPEEVRPGTEVSAPVLPANSAKEISNQLIGQTRLLICERKPEL